MACVTSDHISPGAFWHTWVTLEEDMSGQREKKLVRSLWGILHPGPFSF